MRSCSVWSFASLTWCDVFEVNRCSMPHVSYCQRIFCCLDILHLIYPSTSKWTFGLFLLFHFSAWYVHAVFISLRWLPRCTYLGQMMNQYFKVAASNFAVPPTNSAWGFQFLHFLAETCWDWIQISILVIWFSNIFFWSMHVFSLFLMVSFEMPNLFYLNEAQLIFFSFYQCIFGIMSKKSTPNWMSVSSWCWPKILLAWFRRNWPVTPCIQMKDLYSGLWPEATPMKVCQQLS